MSIDLDALRERAMPMRDGFYHVVGYYRAFRREDFDALIAEVKRLRGERDHYRRAMEFADAEAERLREENAALVLTSADLCPECGWRFFVPDNGCQKCELDRFRVQSVIGSEALARAWDESGDMERAAVAAWLRANTCGCYDFAAAIERGEHRKEDK
jgi:hypothetical protein